MASEVAAKLVNLRKLLTQHNLDVYLINRADPHMSEYLPACDDRLKFISSFSGSNGFALVTQDEALLWTDSRYFIQAPLELEKGWKMMKMLKGEIQWNDWILKNVKENGVVGYNPFLLKADTVETHKKKFAAKKIDLKPIDEDLIEQIWSDRPAKPKDPLFIHEDTYVGRTAQEKIQDIGKELKSTGASHYIVTGLEEIAWTLNLRSNDSENTPFFIAYLVLNFDFNEQTQFKGTLYVLEEKVTAEVSEHLKKLNIQVKSYSEILNDVAKINATIYLDTSIGNSALYNAIQDKSKVVKSDPNIIVKLKGIKNAREIQGFADCHLRDGAAIVSYLAWLDHALNVEKRTDLDEYNVCDKLAALRSEQKLNKGLSFSTISSIGANGAIVHYRPIEGKCAKINTNEVYLLDSGGQYLDGTTDTTRTTHFGTPTQEEKDAYTRVLLGNLDVERVTFPNDGTYSGADIDILARRHLWAVGLNYGHGTGHGVGYFLNVHEGPHGISKFRTYPLKEGMIVTNEPGYYKEGSFGIRIENILVVETRRDGAFLGFRNITNVPYERNLIDVKLLRKEDIEHINNYHQQVYENLEPFLKEKNDQIALKWLKEKTQKL